MNAISSPPTDVKPEELDKLAATARAEHAAGEVETKKGLPHFKAAGEALLKAKAAMKHGEFLAWLTKKVTTFNRMTASRYMRIAKPKNWAKCNTASHLADALRMLRGEKEQASRKPLRVLDPKTIEKLGKCKLTKREQSRLAEFEVEKARHLLVRVLKVEEAATIDEAVIKVVTAAASVKDIAKRLKLDDKSKGKDKPQGKAENKPEGNPDVLKMETPKEPEEAKDAAA